MPNTLEPPLQPLRIPAGWRVTFNGFHKLDNDSLAPSSELWECFREDLLQLEHEQHQIIIDLGWYPESQPTGSFRAVAIRRFADHERITESWDQPLAHATSRSRIEVVAVIEQWLEHYAHKS